MKTLLVLGLFALVPEVREAINAGDFKKAEALVAADRKAAGLTPENVLALSWLGRGALAAKNYDSADKYALETERHASELLKKRKIDAEPNLPLALGASIEVQSQVLAARGERDRALAFLREQVTRYRDTSMRARIQKNINLIDLVGKRAPELDIREHIGTVKPMSLSALRGKPILLFLWAHWCSDCKAQGPVISRLMKEFAPKGLTVIAPTQLYNEVANERQHIAGVLAQNYPDLKSVAVPLSSETFYKYGVSSTPTLVLIDRSSIVRLYRPGRMTYEELAPLIAGIL
ncbi:MAG TPA: redoxin domain-containing protein [Bryobacteraceae bacterium]|nr:redoxin domain-containing protein [Bryobacteraceae bacterium]